MPMTAAQLCARAAVIAHAPGFTAQAGQYLNIVLNDLCQIHDFELAAKTVYGNFDPGLSAVIGNSIYGSGPYALPADFLRWRDDKSAFWTLLGVPYIMIQCDLSEFDMLVQQADIQSYPYIIATDMSLGDETQEGDSTPVFYVYSPPSGNYPYTLRYFSQMPDIATPEASASIPWFPNQGYLLKKTTAYVMGETDDTREAQWHADADKMLREYLIMKDNRSTRATTVKLDRRQFSYAFNRLPNTKQVGW